MIVQLPFPMVMIPPPKPLKPLLRPLKALKIPSQDKFESWGVLPTKQMVKRWDCLPRCGGLGAGKAPKTKKMVLPCADCIVWSLEKNMSPKQLDGIMMAFQSFRMFWRLDFGKQQKAFQKTWFDEIRSCPLFGGNSFFEKTMLEGFHLYYFP